MTGDAMIGTALTSGGMLLGLALATPLLLLVALVIGTPRRRVEGLFGLAPVPALAAAVLATGSRLDLPAPFRLSLSLDTPGALLLGAAALLWIAAGLYTPIWRKARPEGNRGFAAWWLATLAGSIGVFLASDLTSFYLLFSLVSLAGYGLVVADGTRHARRAGAVYVALALLGEAFLLTALVLLALASPGGSLQISDAVGALPASPWRDWTLFFLVLGFGVKMGLVPLHVWMPLSYPAAPIPAAAVLSGTAVKAGVIGLIRFLPFPAPEPAWGSMLVAVGLVSAFFGVAIGVTQKNPKVVLAYSSISQMGVIAAVAGMGPAAGDGTAAIGIAFYAAHHVLVKGGLFLAVGVLAMTARRSLLPVILPAAVIALGVGGLPLTGGFLAKLATKDILGGGLVGTLAALSAAGSTLLMLHFTRRLAAVAGSESDLGAPAALLRIWWAVAIAAILAPWGTWPLTGKSFAETVSAYALWSSAWPILLGAALFLGLLRVQGRLPSVPPGDVLVFGRRALPVAGRIGDRMAAVETRLRDWPVAGTMLLALAVILGAALFAKG